jgi:hypothetical protein
MAEPWMTVKSAGMKSHHREWLVGFAAGVADSKFGCPTIVNIGIYYGASMHCLRRGAPNAILYGVDIKDWGIPRRELLRAHYIWEDSTECHRDFRAKIHLLFLDGVQKYTEVKKDVEGWCPKVAIGGCIVSNTYHLPMPRWGTGKALLEWGAGDNGEWEWIDAPRPMQAFRRLE